MLWRTAPGYLVVASIDGQTLEVGGPGGEIWGLLDEWIAEADVVMMLASRYGVPEMTVAADVVPLLERLKGVGYVERLD